MEPTECLNSIIMNYLQRLSEESCAEALKEYPKTLKRLEDNKETIAMLFALEKVAAWNNYYRRDGFKGDKATQIINKIMHDL